MSKPTNTNKSKIKSISNEPLATAKVDEESFDLSHEVMDEAEEASLRQMQENQNALMKIQAQASPQTHPDFDGKHCIDCDDEIPKERLAWGRIRCVYCQNELEIFEKQHGKR